MAKKAPNPKFASQNTTIKVRTNPYHQLDAKGLLAGTCRQAEPVRPTSAAPLRRMIGARFVVDKYEPVGAANPRRPAGSGLLSRTEQHVEFDGGSFEMVSNGDLGHFYRKRIAAKELIAADDEEAALATLCLERMAAISRFEAAYGKLPSVELWGEQFPDDGLVVEKGAAALAKQAAAAEKNLLAAQQNKAGAIQLERLKAAVEAAKAVAEAAKKFVPKASASAAKVKE